MFSRFDYGDSADFLCVGPYVVNSDVRAGPLRWRSFVRYYDRFFFITGEEDCIFSSEKLAEIAHIHFIYVYFPLNYRYYTKKYSHISQWIRRGFGLVNLFTGSSLVVTTISSYTLKITLTIAHVTSHTKSSITLLFPWNFGTQMRSVPIPVFSHILSIWTTHGKHSPSTVAWRRPHRKQVTWLLYCQSIDALTVA
jgi:hypothetical protein